MATKRGYLLLADPEWLDFHARHSDGKDVVFYRGRGGAIASIDEDGPVFCLRKRETPRRIHAWGDFHGCVEINEAQPWNEFGTRLGAVSEAAWRKQAAGVRKLAVCLVVVLTMTCGWVSAADEGAEQSVAAAPAGKACTTDPEQFAQTRWDVGRKGREIDLGRYKRTFHDDFRTMDIVKEDSPPSPGAVWFSPGHGAFRHNAPLRADGPFMLVDDGLRLRVEKVGKRWLGACMTTVNTRGEGFAQQYGYFEMTARYDYPPPGPNGSRIWGAFWLKSQCDYFNQGTTTRTEIDINEFYGDDGYHATGHLWPAAHLAPDATITRHIFSSGYKNRIGPDLFKGLKVDGVVKGFHRYGGEVTPEWVIMYFDRKEVARFPTMEEWKTPLYMLVDLVITKPEEEAVFPMDMIVKEVSAYQPIEPYESE